MTIVITPAFFENVKARYLAPGRFHHGWDHVEDLTMQFAVAVPLIHRPDVFFASILTHDAVYDPRSKVNERSSYELFEREMARQVLPSDLRAVEMAVMATERHRLPERRPFSSDGEMIEDISLFLDMDLSVLGAGEERYRVFERAIRMEYGHVPLADYIAGRTAVLGGFLARDRIYFTEEYRDRFEAAARANLERAIGTLRLMGEYRAPVV